MSRAETRPVGAAVEGNGAGEGKRGKLEFSSFSTKSSRAVSLFRAWRSRPEPWRSA